MDDTVSSYAGDVASGYDRKRVDEPKWARELEVVDRVLAGLPLGARILDVPVGTGRFLPLYQRHGLQAVGVDLSPDMLDLAARRAREIGYPADLRLGNAAALDVDDDVFDAACCIRLWLPVPSSAAVAVLTELRRVTDGPVFFSDREAQALLGAGLGGLPRAVGRRAKRAVSNTRRRLRRRPPRRPHRRAQVLRAFDEAGLRPTDRIPLDRLGGFSDYGLWVLERR